MRSLVRGLFGIGERKQAIARQRELVDHCTNAFGVDSPQDAKAKWKLRQYEASVDVGSVSASPDIASARSRSMAAIAAKEKAYSQLIESRGATDDGTIAARMELAGALISAGHTIEALNHVTALEALTMERYGPLDERTLNTQRNMVFVLLKLSRLVDAIRPQQAIVAALRERDGGTAESTMDAEYSLERRYFYAGLEDENRAYLKDLLQRRIKLFGKNHVNTIMLQPIEGGDAVTHLKEVIRVMSNAYGENSRSTAEAIGALARHYATTGRVAEAIPFYAECGSNMLDDTWLNFECASFQLWAGDVDGFRKTRRNIANYWERRIRLQRSMPDQFARAIWLCCIAELDDEAQKDVVRKLLKHVEEIRSGLHTEANDRQSKPQQNMIRGAALYRLGMYEESFATMDKTIRTMNPGDNQSLGFEYAHLKLWGHFFMAMSQQRLGNNGEAKRLFDLGSSLLIGEVPSRENPVVEYVVGGEPLTAWIMHSEAKALIFGE